MVRKKNHIIIPIFIPFMSCPGNCIFCDQKRITGVKSVPSTHEISKIISEALAKNRKASEDDELIYQAAFYGGSFTLAPRKMQVEWINAARKYSSKSTVRVSTRPDAVDFEWFKKLTQNGLHTVEIGVQSCDETVLEKTCRNHTVADIVKASRIVKKLSLKLGLQIMTGLPGQSRETILKTADKIIDLNPDFVRIYPALVFKNTRMAEMYQKGEYTPFDLYETIRIIAPLMVKFYNAGIKIIRIGLHGDRDFFSEDILDGPIEQGIRQRVLGYIFRRCLENLFKKSLSTRGDKRKFILLFPPGKADVITGYKGLKKIQNLFFPWEFTIEESIENRGFTFEVKEVFSNESITGALIDLMDKNNISFL